MKIIERLLTKNHCCQKEKKIAVKGPMIHSNRCPQPSAKLLVQSRNSASVKTCIHPAKELILIVIDKIQGINDNVRGALRENFYFSATKIITQNLNAKCKETLKKSGLCVIFIKK